MSKGYRLRNYAIGLAAGGLVSVFIGYFALWEPTISLQEQIELQASEAAEKYQNGAYISVECEAAGITDASEPKCLNAEREAAKDAERNQRDLESQRTMAVWTQAMGKAAIVGTSVGIIGLFLIFVTFWETRKAADAGRQANIIARPPRLAVVQVQTEIIGSKITGKLHVINEGRSQATICRSAIHVLVGGKKLPQVHPTAGGEGDPNPIKDMPKQLTAGDVFWWPFESLEIDPAKLRSVTSKRGRASAYVVGLLKYKDTLGDFHHTLFCREFDPERGRWMPVDDPDYEYQH